MKTLETNRLILRPFKERDAADFFAYASLPDVGPNAGWKPHETIEESRKILREFIEEDEVWALEDKISRKVIGSLGLHTDAGRSNPKARMLGYCLAPSFWGKGLMTEAAGRALRFAFEDLEMDLVCVAPDCVKRQQSGESPTPDFYAHAKNIRHCWRSYALAG